MTDQTIQVRENPEQARFDVLVDGELAGFTEYHPHPADAGVRVFPHTEVFPDFEGRGLSKPLIREALDATRAAGLRVVPQCPAVARFIEKNPDYADLVASV
ncbi:GNAT family N-acetyltransferase [Nocardioides sp.]|uniref:GNAT family N-acetyltransferase n=1 Tax=Nocardioides sp. TaxID=35761 RepID=UPI0035128636